MLLLPGYAQLTILSTVSDEWDMWSFLVGPRWQRENRKIRSAAHDFFLKCLVSDYVK